MEVSASAWTDSSVVPWNNHYKMTTVDFNGNESPTGVGDVVSGVPDSDVVRMFTLGNAVPNPFNPVTEIHYSVPTAG